MRVRSFPRTLFVLSLGLAVMASSCGGDSGDSDAGETDNTGGDVDASDGADQPGDATGSDDDSSQADKPESDDPDATFEGDLVGLFGVLSTECSTAGAETGSYFRMVAIGGAVADGPFIPNGDSTCADQSFIELNPGADGGLLTGSLQPGSEPLFDDDGNATANRITEPTPFFAVAFAMATTDEAPPPSITASSGVLSGDLAGVSAYYAGLIFNQGAPKPDGSTPGITSAAPVGTIDPDTGAYTLDWASQIVGGAFNEFTGVWHLEGTFTPAG